MQVLEQNGIVYAHKAQQFKSKHFAELDYVVVMDESNYSDVLQLGSSTDGQKVFMMRSFDSIDKNAAVTDPWYGDISDFKICYETLDRCTDTFLHFLVEKHNISSL
jgi:protein-tyrosine-phosphatase